MKVVVFDLDDTLYSEQDYVFSAYRAIASSLYKDCGLSETEILKILHDSWSSGENGFDNLVKQYSNVDIPLLLDIYRYHTPNIKLSDSCKRMLGNLQGKVKLGLITDGRTRSQQNKIKSLGLDAYIADEDIIISEKFGSEKTNIANFQYFCNKYPHAESFFYIGDNPKKDFVRANELGWITIQLRDAGNNIHSQDVTVSIEYMPQYVINNISEVLDLIINNNK